jgi:nitrogen fixation NifU-like protein
MNELRQVLSDLVIQRSKHPRFEGILASIDCAGSARNPYCGDIVCVALRLDTSRTRLNAVRCSVEGCALCKASADLMAECLEGCSVSEVEQFGKDFERLITTGTQSWAEDHPLRSLVIFAALHTVPARSPCAVLPWKAMRQALIPRSDFLY